jgi:hypothetical protein
MIELLTRPIGRLRSACALGLVGATLACVPSLALTLSCTQVTSSGSTSCTDAGGVPSTCASVACPAGFTLTGAGGACAAGGSRIKSLFPVLRNNTVEIMCDQQGVPPEVNAVCCRVQ